MVHSTSAGTISLVRLGYFIWSVWPHQHHVAGLPGGPVDKYNTHRR